jgi:transcriptional regulator with XRE-family HTH domain
LTRFDLNEIRKKKGLSFERMEEQTNVAAGTFKNFFYNKTGAPRLDTADAIAKMLGVTVDDILYSDVEDIKETIEEMDNPDAISVIALKRIYEFQMEAKDAMHEREKEEIRSHYERQIAEIKNNQKIIEEHYERRLADKREHIETILLDKKWFRIAAVVGVVALLAVFFFIEFMTPGHGWFTFGGTENDSFVYILGGVTIIELIAIIYFATRKKEKNK